MNRQQFIDTLRRELSKLPSGEVDDIISYYEEYFEEAGPENEQAVIQELGSPVKIASQMKANYAVKQIDNKKSGTKGIAVFWWVLLGVLAAPVAVPIAITAVVILLLIMGLLIGTAVMALFGIGLFFITGLALVVAGITSFGAGIGTALVGIGGGLALAGVMLLLGYLVLIAVKAAFKSLAKTVNRRRQQKAMDRENQARKAVKNGKDSRVQPQPVDREEIAEY